MLLSTTYTGEGIFSSSASQSAADASDGIRQSPRGERVTEPTFGPSGMQERLNCCEKKRRIKVLSQCIIISPL